MAKARRPQQTEFRFRKHGGARPGAGRPPRAERAGFVPHVRRPAHQERYPVHVTLRAVARAPNLRAQRVFALIEGELAGAVKRGARILHFAVQRNHIHLIVEAADRVRLWRAMQRFTSRVAHGVNATAKRNGALWADRYHRTDLTSPSQTRNALVYVMFNERKHSLGGARELEINLATLDPYSSAKWFTEWDPVARPPPAALASRTRETCPLADPRSWLARTGWTKAGGRLRFDEMPRPSLRG